MKKNDGLFELTLNDNVLEWLKHYGDNFKPKSKAAYRKFLIAYFEYLKARYEDSTATEPLQAESQEE